MLHQESVAGVYAPAFVERYPCAENIIDSFGVSPGFMPRPSLSGGIGAACGCGCSGVAGVYAPAFVERLR